MSRAVPAAKQRKNFAIRTVGALTKLSACLLLIYYQHHPGLKVVWFN